MIWNAAAIYSTLGNSSSLIPIAVKDMTATAGMTASSFVTGKEEGRDRFIDEIGTEIIWLLGIPFFKGIFNNTIFKMLKLDSKYDARNLQNKEIFEKTKKYAPDEDVKKAIEKIGSKEKLFKNAVMAKFVTATSLAVGSYIWLTKLKHNYTERQIRKNLINEYNKRQEEKKNAQNVAFKGKFIEGFVFNPVKNMYILDGAITGERLKDSRNTQEFIGYGIKEAFTLCFMYYAGGKIQKLVEKRANQKHKKNIELDARVIEDKHLKEIFDDGSIVNSIREFKSANTSEGNLYEFIINNPKNEIIKMAKQSEIIKMYKKTDKIDTRKYIDLSEVEGIKNKAETLYNQYKEALSKGESSEQFFEQLKKLKRSSIRTNIGACMLALGVITPGIMLMKRFMTKSDREFSTKKEIREQLVKEGIIK